MILSNKSKLKSDLEQKNLLTSKNIVTAGEQASSSTKKSLGSQAGCHHHTIIVSNVVVVFITNTPRRVMTNLQASPKQSSQWGGVKHLYRADQGFQFDLSPSKKVKHIDLFSGQHSMELWRADCCRQLTTPKGKEE